MSGAWWILVIVAATGVVMLTLAIGPRLEAWLRLRWHGRRRRRR